MDYAIIKLGNKQHRVRDGETLVVDRLPTGAGEVFEPVVLLGDATVTATVLEHGRGKKILIGKYRRRTGYKRHNGFRAATSKVEITIGAGTARKAPRRRSRRRRTRRRRSKPRSSRRRLSRQPRSRLRRSRLPSQRPPAMMFRPGTRR